MEGSDGYRRVVRAKRLMHDTTTARRAEIEARLNWISLEVDHVQVLDPYSARFREIGAMLDERRVLQRELATLAAAQPTEPPHAQ